MAALIVDLRAQVVAAINAGTYSEAVQAVAVDLPTLRLEELGERRVEVMPRQLTRTRAARGLWTREAKVVVGIQRRLKPTERLDEGDAEFELSDAIGEQLETYAWTGAALLEVTEEPTIHPERLNEHSVFCRVLVLRFQIEAVNL